MFFSIIFLFISFLVAELKVIIEYASWSKKKNEVKFHNTGFTYVTLIFFICLSTQYLYQHNLIETLRLFFILWFGYYNIFEISNNYFHNQDILYIGYNSRDDKWIRKTFKYPERFKFFFQLITLILLVLIILYFDSTVHYIINLF